LTAARDIPTLAPPAPPVTGWAKVKALLDLTFVDHGFIRAVYSNRHRVSEKLWRSAQPGPGHLRWAKAHGIKTILNLRGQRDTCGAYQMERDAAATLGLTLINVPCRSRGMPEKTTLHGAAKLFAEMEYPVLIHCKSGADRAGFFAALYLHLHEGVPMPQAMGELSIWYGHVKAAKTGMLDRFLERYIADTGGEDPARFLPWVDETYDPVAFAADFSETRAGSFLVDRILRRE
jgi:protein tyrosine phosphatase (PTP) superfamily phosphohydrolase (DUF442 family)